MPVATGQLAGKTARARRPLLLHLSPVLGFFLFSVPTLADSDPGLVLRLDFNLPSPFPAQPVSGPLPPALLAAQTAGGVLLGSEELDLAVESALRQGTGTPATNSSFPLSIADDRH